MQATIQRFALIVGANNGGNERSILRYAQRDAGQLAHVLQDLGGVSPETLIRLDDPSPNGLTQAFERIIPQVAAASHRGPVHFVFYYSGHSDETGLLLGSQSFSYRELRQWIDRIPADVRIAILDSCASGAFTRLKGGTKEAPFLVAPVSDVQGHAFLSSSSIDEAAQESDRIGGSYFTHFLMSGLRGAADKNRDRQVTLAEAYEFAFDATLAQTESTRGGPQHAAYDIQLSGSGELIMTDLRQTTGRLLIDDAIAGRISVRNTQGDLAAELYKPSGTAAVLLALEPGTYRVSIHEGQALWLADVTVDETREVELTRAKLVPAALEDTVQRGPSTNADSSDSDVVDVPFSFGFIPPWSMNRAHQGQRIRNRGNIAFVYNQVALIDGAALALGATIVTERTNGAQFSIGANINTGMVNGGQIAWVVNLARQIRGAQMATVNVARALKGAQLGIFNFSGQLQGTQLGLINVAPAAVPQLQPNDAVTSPNKSYAVQLALINIGGNMKGAQIGLINAAKDTDAQIGLISWTRKGGVHPEIWTSDIATTLISLRLPARRTYSLLSFGIAATHHQAWMFGFGLGGRIQLPKRAFIDIDGTAYAVSDGLGFKRFWGSLEQIRILAGWAPRERFSFFGGPTLNFMAERIGRDEQIGRPGYGWSFYTRTFDSGDVSRLRFWVGFAAGLRF